VLVERVVVALDHRQEQAMLEQLIQAVAVVQYLIQVHTLRKLAVLVDQVLS
jgi:hypothetical protein